MKTRIGTQEKNTLKWRNLADIFDRVLVQVPILIRGRQPAATLDQEAGPTVV